MEHIVKQKLSSKTLGSLDRAIMELCTSGDVGQGHLPTLNGLLACAGLVYYGHPISKDLRDMLREALTQEAFKAHACELLGPP